MIDLARHHARELSKLGIRIDWKATFESFVDAHGGLPVKHGAALPFMHEEHRVSVQLPVGRDLGAG